MALLKKWCRKSPSIDRIIPCFTLVRCGAWFRVLAAFDCHELSTTDGVTQDDFCSTYRGSRLFSLLEKSHKYFKELTRNGEKQKGSDLHLALKQITILCLTLDTCNLISGYEKHYLPTSLGFVLCFLETVPSLCVHLQKWLSFIKRHTYSTIFSHYTEYICYWDTSQSVPNMSFKINRSADFTVKCNIKVPLAAKVR